MCIRVYVSDIHYSEEMCSDFQYKEQCNSKREHKNMYLLLYAFCTILGYLYIGKLALTCAYKIKFLSLMPGAVLVK